MKHIFLPPGSYLIAEETSPTLVAAALVGSLAGPVDAARIPDAPVAQWTRPTGLAPRARKEKSRKLERTHGEPASSCREQRTFLRCCKCILAIAAARGGEEKGRGGKGRKEGGAIPRSRRKLRPLLYLIKRRKTPQPIIRRSFRGTEIRNVEKKKCIWGARFPKSHPSLYFFSPPLFFL